MQSFVTLLPDGGCNIKRLVNIFESSLRLEGLGLIGDQFGLTGWFWDGIGGLNENFNSLGFVIIGVFIAAWIGSILIYRYKGLDEIEITST